MGHDNTINDANATNDLKPQSSAAGEPPSPTNDDSDPARNSHDDDAYRTSADAPAPADAPTPPEADSPTADADDPVLEVDELRAERDQWRDRHLRLAADFDNYRKRSDERMRARWNRAQADLAARLLDPLDDLIRISELDHETSTNAEAVLEGAGLVERKFLRILEEVGVEVVNPVGEPFDPNTMEAMMRVAAESEDDDDMVERVFQKGYVLKGQLLRPARVSVYKAE